MFIYETVPIDHWQGWLTMPEAAAKLCVDGLGFTHEEELRHLADNLEEAKRLAKAAGWEGDMREGPFVSMLPNQDNTVSYVIAWKQDNNGSTFVASPYQLQWLGDPMAKRKGWP